MRRPAIEHHIDRFKLSYDPDDVNIRLQHFRIQNLVDMIDNQILDIADEDYEFLDDPDEIKAQQKSLFENYIDLDGEDDLQRNVGLWNITQKSQFIESLMIRLPIPLFYLDGSNKTWRVIDGLQRLNTIISFIRNRFRLSNLEYLSKECNGLFFDDPNFPIYLKNRILNAEIIAYVINPGTPPDVKYNIFKRINTGGLKLNGQEIRNAFFRGTPAEFVKSLAKEQLFKDVTNNKISPKRMVDREYINRFIAFQLFGYEEYSGKMDLFLSETMLLLYDFVKEDFETLTEAFIRSMHRSLTLFGGQAFYRIKPDGSSGRQPNKALFDTLSWNLGRLKNEEFDLLVSYQNRFRDAYTQFLQAEGMSKLINDTTGNRSSVTGRFTQLQNFLYNFLNDYANRAHQF